MNNIVGVEMHKYLALFLVLGLLGGCTSIEEPQVAQSTVEKSQESEDSPTPQPSFETSNLRIDPSLCKFEDKTPGFATRDPWMSFNYFPNMQADPYLLPSLGEVNLALVFLNWIDMPGTDDDRNYYLEQVDAMTSWFELVSQSKYQLNWRIADSWNALPGSWKDYKRGALVEDSDEEDPIANQALLDKISEVTDADFDYRDIDYVVFAIPRSGSLTEQGTEVGDVVFYAGPHGFQSFIHPNPDPLMTEFRTDEGSMGNWVLAGTSFQDKKNRSPAWVLWAHEMGHMFGYVSHAPMPGAETWGDSTSQYEANPMSAGGLFANQWNPVRAVSGWTSWVAGWLDDDQIQCVEAQEVTEEVFAINNSRNVGGTTKAVILRTGETTGLVIESREWDPVIDPTTIKAKNGFYDGVFMYHIDSSRDISDQSLIPLLPNGQDEVYDTMLWPGPATSSVDSMFQEGESAEYGDFRIQVLSMQEGVDYVKVTRIQN